MSYLEGFGFYSMFNQGWLNNFWDTGSESRPTENMTSQVFMEEL